MREQQMGVKILIESPLVTMIVPVYKTQSYLNRCIQSIVCQTYQNIEVILVDDGSPDECPRICDEWATADPRIRVIHQENAGVSCARNNALQIARGKWMTFVDSDDTIEPCCIERAVVLAETHKCDAVTWNYNIVKGGITQKMPDLTFPNQDMVYTGDICEILQDIFYTKTKGVYFGNSRSPCMRLYLVDKVKNHQILFPTNMKIGEDAVFNAKYFSYCKKVVFVNEHWYNYFIHSESATGTPNPNLAKYTDLEYQFAVNEMQWPSNKIKNTIAVNCVLSATRSQIGYIEKSQKNPLLLYFDIYAYIKKRRPVSLDKNIDKEKVFAKPTCLAAIIRWHMSALESMIWCFTALRWRALENVAIR